MVFVLEDDLISFLNCKVADGVATIYGTWIEWLVKEVNAAINTRLEQLPLKSKKVIPFIYWVAAPLHSFFSKQCNNLRVKYNLSLESVIKGQNNMRVIKMKDHWNPKDSKLVVHDRITELGLTNYWAAVNASIQFNIERRETYVAKQVWSSKHLQQASTATASQKMSKHVNQDPMWTFFRRHNYVEHHKDLCEDHYRHSHAAWSHGHTCDRREHGSDRFNRFLLPRLHDRCR